MSMQSSHEVDRGTLKSYVTGFVLSVILTLAAYFIVVESLLSGWALAFAIVELGLIQLFVQLIFFLHLGRESNPKWNLTVFLFAALIVTILVFGSLWIMHNLHYNVMSPGETDIMIQDEELIYRPSR